MRRNKARRAFMFALVLSGVFVYTIFRVERPGEISTTGVDLRSHLVYEAPEPTLSLDTSGSTKFEDKRGTIEKLQSGGFDVNMLFTKKGYKVSVCILRCAKSNSYSQIHCLTQAFGRSAQLHSV
jgi:hypothetical protein